MKVKIQLANSLEQLAEAQSLVEKTYQDEFEIDLRELAKIKSQGFEYEVLIAISEDTQEILGTLSFMYPTIKGIFPCESYFGFNMDGFVKRKIKHIEIGRFATSENGRKHRIVVLSLFLGIAHFLEKRKIKGWIATVKDNIFNFFKQIELPMNCIDQKPILAPDDLMWEYIKDVSTLHLFSIKSSLSIISFKKFQRFVDEGLVEIKI